MEDYVREREKEIRDADWFQWVLKGGRLLIDWGEFRVVISSCLPLSTETPKRQVGCCAGYLAAAVRVLWGRNFLSKRNINPRLTTAEVHRAKDLLTKKRGSLEQLTQSPWCFLAGPIDFQT